MPKKSTRVDTSGGPDLTQGSPFSALDAAKLGPLAEPSTPPRPVVAAEKTVGHGARLEIRRLKAGKGGKVVTEVSGFTGHARSLLPEWARILKQRLGVGGAVKDGRLEIQGDHREAAAVFFREEGFRPVFAGG